MSNKLKGGPRATGNRPNDQKAAYTSSKVQPGADKRSNLAQAIRRLSAQERTRLLTRVEQLRHLDHLMRQPGTLTAEKAATR